MIPGCRDEAHERRSATASGSTGTPGRFIEEKLVDAKVTSGRGPRVERKEVMGVVR